MKYNKRLKLFLIYLTKNQKICPPHSSRFNIKDYECPCDMELGYSCKYCWNRYINENFKFKIYEEI